MILAANITQPPQIRVCNLCEGIDLPPATPNCPCSDGLFWTGTKCVERNLCPCVDLYTT